LAVEDAYVLSNFINSSNSISSLHKNLELYNKNRQERVKPLINQSIFFDRIGQQNFSRFKGILKEMKIRWFFREKAQLVELAIIE